MNSWITRSLFVLCICLVTIQALNAQDASRIYIEPTGWSIGTEGGLSDLWGNIGTTSPIDHYANSKYFDKVCFMGGIFGRYTVHPCFALKLTANYGSLYATDKWNYDLAKKATSQGADAYQRYARNQDAKDVMFESTLQMEIDLFRFNPESKSAHRRGQPFLVGGIGVFHFTPYSTVGNSPTWVRTYPLDLEGQGFAGPGYPKQFSLWQPCIPLGIGYRWDIGQHLNIGLEYVWRMCFTKYLDGVSGPYIGLSQFQANLPASQAQTAYLVEDKSYFNGLSQPQTAGNLRGNASYEDSYSTITLTIYWKIESKNREWWH